MELCSEHAVKHLGLPEVERQADAAKAAAQGDHAELVEVVAIFLAAVVMVVMVVVVMVVVVMVVVMDVAALMCVFVRSHGDFLRVDYGEVGLGQHSSTIKQ
jgi:Flp pilus assembly protein TadB